MVRQFRVNFILHSKKLTSGVHSATHFTFWVFLRSCTFVKVINFHFQHTQTPTDTHRHTQTPTDTHPESSILVSNPPEYFPQLSTSFLLPPTSSTVVACRDARNSRSATPGCRRDIPRVTMRSQLLVYTSLHPLDTYLSCRPPTFVVGMRASRSSLLLARKSWSVFHPVSLWAPVWTVISASATNVIQITRTNKSDYALLW